MTAQRLRRQTKVRRVTRRLLAAVALVFAAMLIWRRVRIVLFVRLSLGQLLLLFLGVALAIYVLFEILLSSAERR